MNRLLERKLLLLLNKESYFASCDRDDEGRCKAKTGGRSSMIPAKKKDGKWLLPEHMKGVYVSPSLTDVHVSEDPDSDLLAYGYDAKGRKQSTYSKAHWERQADAKFSRTHELIAMSDRIAGENEDNLRSKDPSIRELAAVTKLIHVTGIRPGSDRDTKAEKQAYGATTLRASHVVKTKDGVSLQFTGKKGVDLNIPIKDKSLAKMLLARKSKGGRLFDVTDSSLRDYVHSLDGGKFYPKDFRTALATKTAQQLVGSISPPRDPKSYKTAVKQVATEVSQRLGNTPTVALQSYINPTVFKEWRNMSHAA